MKKIPFSKISFNRKERKAINDCIKSGWVVLGPKTLEFEKAFANYVGSNYAVFVDSGTAALFLAIKMAFYEDFVTIPSLTFVSDAEAIHNAGLKIKFADINMDTLCVDKVYKNLIPTNFAGVRARSANDPSIKVVDSCHRFEVDDLRGSNAMWCYSFYATKNMTTVQGGMIALNNREKYEWLLMARDHGATKGTKQRYSGKDPIYDVLFPGWRVKPDDLRASIGLEQLKKLPILNKKRSEYVKIYNDLLNYNNMGNHLYPVFVENRSEFIRKMHDVGIQTSVHFRPIHTLLAYKRNLKLPNTNCVADRIVSLPLYPDMGAGRVKRVCKEVLKTNLLIKPKNE